MSVGKLQQAEYSRQHYQKNKAAYLKRASAHNKKMRYLLRDWTLNYLSSHPCIDCGEQDAIVIEFDHRQGVEKRFDIARAVSSAHVGQATLEAEIAKCDVRCANCHRRKTAKERGWFRHLAMETK